MLRLVSHGKRMAPSYGSGSLARAAALLAQSDRERAFNKMLGRRLKAAREPRHELGRTWSYQTFVEGAKVKRLNERESPCQRSARQIEFGGSTSSSRHIGSSSPLK